MQFLTILISIPTCNCINNFNQRYTECKIFKTEFTLYCKYKELGFSYNYVLRVFLLDEKLIFIAVTVLHLLNIFKRVSYSWSACCFRQFWFFYEFYLWFCLFTIERTYCNEKMKINLHFRPTMDLTGRLYWTRTFRVNVLLEALTSHLPRF